MKMVLNIGIAIVAGVLTVLALGYFRYESNLADLADGCRQANTAVNSPSGFCECMVETIKADLGFSRGIVISSPTLRAMTGARESEIKVYAEDAALKCRA